MKHRSAVELFGTVVFWCTKIRNIIFSAAEQQAPAYPQQWRLHGCLLELEQMVVQIASYVIHSLGIYVSTSPSGSSVGFSVFSAFSG